MRGLCVFKKQMELCFTLTSIFSLDVKVFKRSDVYVSLVSSWIVQLSRVAKKTEQQRFGHARLRACKCPRRCRGLTEDNVLDKVEGVQRSEHTVLMRN